MDSALMPIAGIEFGKPEAEEEMEQE